MPVEKIHRKHPLNLKVHEWTPQNDCPKCGYECSNIAQLHAHILNCSARQKHQVLLRQIKNKRLATIYKFEDVAMQLARILGVLNVPKYEHETDRFQFKKRRSTFCNSVENSPISPVSPTLQSLSVQISDLASNMTPDSALIEAQSPHDSVMSAAPRRTPRDLNSHRKKIEDSFGMIMYENTQYTIPIAMGGPDARKKTRTKPIGLKRATKKRNPTGRGRGRPRKHPLPKAKSKVNSKKDVYPGWVQRQQ